MKPFPRFSVSTLALGSIFLLGVGLTRAEEPDNVKSAAVENLLKAMHTEQMLDTTANNVITQVDHFTQGAKQQATLTTDQANAIQKAEDDAHDSVRKELSYGAFKDGFVKIYADAFSEDELKQLTNFYNSPVGQKFTDQQPNIGKQLGQLTQQKLRAVMPGVVAKLREAIQKNSPPPPTPAMVVPPPAAPGAPAAPGTPVTPPVAPAPAAPVVTPPTAVTAPVPAPVPVAPVPAPTPVPPAVPAPTPAAE